MKNNTINNNFDIIVVGGGLTGKLITSILIANGLTNLYRICWINNKKEKKKDTRVSFVNNRNFIRLKNIFNLKFDSKDYQTINKIEVHNFNSKSPLSINDIEGHGVIIENEILNKKLNVLRNNIAVYSSKVVDTVTDEIYRTLLLENGTKLKAKLVISADGHLSTLRSLCKIKFVNHDLDHTIVSGYLSCKNFVSNSAKQVFLHDSFIGLLPVANNKNLINFVWSLDNKKIKISNLKCYDEIVKRLNKFFLKSKISFQSPKSKRYKIFELQIYPMSIKFVKDPFEKKIALIGDAAHSIHPLAGQGFNLSIEDCFDIEKCIKEALSVGKDLNDISILFNYSSMRKKRKNFMTLATTSIFYLFNDQNRSSNTFLNFGLESFNSTSMKAIFKYLAKGY